MKTELFLLPIAFAVLTSCGNQEPTIPWMNDSNTLGQLSYVANPFNPEKDSILCLRNISYIYCTTFTDEYYSYIKNLFSACKGHFEESKTPAPRNDNHLIFYPQSDMCIYPIRSGEFISVMDKKSGRVLDSITLAVSIEVGNRKDVSTATIYTKPNNQEKGENTQEFYMGDFVVFQGNDHMQPPFISDSITPSGKLIICIDGEHGPISAATLPKE